MMDCLDFLKLRKLIFLIYTHVQYAYVMVWYPTLLSAYIHAVWMTFHGHAHFLNAVLMKFQNTVLGVWFCFFSCMCTEDLYMHAYMSHTPHFLRIASYMYIRKR